MANHRLFSIIIKEGNENKKYTTYGPKDDANIHGKRNLFKDLEEKMDKCDHITVKMRLRYRK